jgi:hypothetical protein
MLTNTDVSAWLMNVVDEDGFTVIVLSFTAAVKVIDRPVGSALKTATS